MEQDGYMTVEAVLLIPFLILITAVMIYFTIYIYDRAIIVADVNSMAMEAMGARNKEEAVLAVGRIYKEIKGQHPYLSLDDIELSLSADMTKISIGISGKWKLPVWNKFERTISYEKTVKYEDPIRTMYIVNNIEAAKGRFENAD